MLSHFSSTAIDSYGTLHLALRLVGMYSTVASKVFPYYEYVFKIFPEEYKTYLQRLLYVDY